MAQLLHDSRDFDQVMAKDPQDGTEIILVRAAGDIHAYRNSCPHIGVGLDYGDGRCLEDADTLVCALHGARFEAHTGYCFEGPCVGQSLARVPIRVGDDGVFLAGD